MAPGIFAALLLSALPALAAAAEIPLPTAVAEVTVHPSSAEVLRRGSLRVPAGSVRLLIEGLPVQLVDETVRLEASGSARARLLGVSVEAQPRAESTSPEVREQERLVRTLEERDRALQDRIAAANEQKRFLEALRSDAARRQGEAMAGGAVDTRSWARTLDFVGERFAAIAAEIRGAEGERQQLAGELEAARQRLAQIRSLGNRAAKRVVVDLEVERAGTLEVELAYLAQGAGWQPSWNARLDPAAGRLELGLEARVHQRTGEDWKGVRLSVSTAEPERHVELPELQPLYLHRAPPPGVPAPRREALQKSAAAPSVAAEDRAGEAALVPEVATVDAGLVATRFTASRPATIPSTGEGRQTFLASWSFAATLGRLAAPSREPRAFLTAKAKNETDVPLIGGPLDLFVDGSFVGRTHLEPLGPGEEIELAFGPDPRISVERTVLERRREESGLLSKRETWRYRIRTTVENRWREAVEVDLLDRFPVSREESIEVEILDGTSKGGEEEPNLPGVRRWKLALKPGEKRAVELRYTVSFPRGMRVVGLP